MSVDSYARDPGGVVNDLSVPLDIDGRRWGGAAYRLSDPHRLAELFVTHLGREVLEVGNTTSGGVALALARSTCSPQTPSTGARSKAAARRTRRGPMPIRRRSAIRPSYLRVVESPDDIVATGEVELVRRIYVFAVYATPDGYRALIEAAPDRIFETIDSTLEGALTETVDYAEECLILAPG